MSATFHNGRNSGSAEMWVTTLSGLAVLNSHRYFITTEKVKCLFNKTIFLLFWLFRNNTLMILDFINKKPKWQHRNIEVRKSAVENLDDLSILSDIAQHDEESTVRLLAVQKLTDLRLLENIAHHDPEATVREMATHCFQKLFCSAESIEIDLATRLHWLAEITELELLEYIARHGQETELRLAATQKIDSDSVLGEIAIQDLSSEIRLVAADKLTHKTTLEQVFKASRNRDKGVSRIVRDKLDALQAQQDQVIQIRNDSETICKRLETLGRTQLWEQEQAEYQHLQERWQAIANQVDHEYQQRFSLAQQAFQMVYQHYQQQREQLLQREQLWLATRDQLCQEVDTWLAELQTPERLSEAELEPLTQRLQTLQQQWQDQVPPANLAAAEQPWQTRFERTCQHIQLQLKNLHDSHEVAKALEQLYRQAEDWLNQPGVIQAQSLADLKAQWQAVSLPATPTLLLQTLNSNFEHAMAELHTRWQQQKERTEQNSQQLKELLITLETALERGELKTALPLEPQIRELLKTTVGLSANLQKKLESRLQKCVAKITEFRGWQSWGNKLEREKLCQQLEELIVGEEDEAADTLRLVRQIQENWRNLGPVGYSQDLKERFQLASQTAYSRYREHLCRQVETLLESPQPEPEAQARFIREAQSIWKKLGPLGHSQELWERFNTACNTAYEPCQQYFKQQAVDRQQHLAQKTAICEQLETRTINNENPDWKAVYQFIRQLENEWKRMGPIDRKARKLVQKRYDKAMRPWQEQLAAEQQRNSDIRSQLIAQVQAVTKQLEADPDSLEEAIAVIKKLQAQWQVTVPGSRRDERQLWREFRKACDVVFEQRKQQQETAQRELQTHLERKVALCEQVEALAKSIGATVKTAPSQIKQIQEEFKSLNAGPKKAGDPLDRRFDNACRQAYRQIELQRQAQLATEQQQQLEWLRQKAACCVKLELSNLTAEKIVEVTADWEHLPKLDQAELEMTINQRFQTALAGQCVPQADTLKLKKTWCIRLEILAGIESPSEEVEARLAYQVARLSEAMSGGEKTRVKDKLTEVQDIEKSWYLSGPVPSDLATTLEQRFAKAREAIYAQGVSPLSQK
ncbi:MAG: hypothetical protein BWK78_07380 [Thiotrichaceae bacterium IS1]|nr:MAG: hypothetical protein BWK78_07380 [Thiotrichaceae bacterium IS1]